MIDTRKLQAQIAWLGVEQEEWLREQYEQAMQRFTGRRIPERMPSIEPPIRDRTVAAAIWVCGAAAYRSKGRDCAFDDALRWCEWMAKRAVSTDPATVSGQRFDICGAVP